MRNAKDRFCDRVIFLGDFGWNFSDDFTKLCTELYDETGLFVEFLDGNHEDFDYLLSFPVEDDGYRHIARGLLHIPRGTVLQFGDKHALVMGGASSIDKEYRIPHASWWPQENITAADMNRAVDSLRMVGKVDAVFAHDAPVMPGGSNKSDDLWKYGPRIYNLLSVSLSNRVKLETLMELGQPKFWYHGHHHTRFTTHLTTSYGTCIVEAMNRDETSLNSNIIVVETEDW